MFKVYKDKNKEIYQVTDEYDILFKNEDGEMRFNSLYEVRVNINSFGMSKIQSIIDPALFILIGEYMNVRKFDKYHPEYCI